MLWAFTWALLKLKDVGRLSCTPFVRVFTAGFPETMRRTCQKLRYKSVCAEVGSVLF